MSAEQQALVNQIFDSSTSVDDLKWKDSFRTQEVLQEIINNKNKITSPLIAAKVGWFFRKFAELREGKKMAATNEVYDVIINRCAKQATATESVQRVGHAIGDIANNNPDGQRLFSTPETFSFFNNALQKYATTPESVLYLSFSVYHICKDNPAGLKLFATNEFISALENVKKYATTPSSGLMWDGCLTLLQNYLKQNPQQSNNQSAGADASPIQNNLKTSKAVAAEQQKPKPPLDDESVVLPAGKPFGSAASVPVVMPGGTPFGAEKKEFPHSAVVFRK
jgi:hypothetical protein